MADIPNNQQPNTDPLEETMIHCMIRNRYQVLFEGDVSAVTSKNDTGVFDVLPEHSNFISVINEIVTIHKRDGTTQAFPLTNGIMKVKNSSISCYLDLITISNNAFKH